MRKNTMTKTTKNAVLSAMLRAGFHPWQVDAADEYLDRLSSREKRRIRKIMKEVFGVKL